MPFDDDPQPWYKNKKFLIFVGVLLFICVVIFIGLGIGLKKEENDSLPPNSSPSLSSLMSGLNVMEHLVEFESIAFASEGSRTAITGYNASVAYVEEILSIERYYDVSRQYFQFPFFQELTNPTFSQVSPVPTNYIYKTHFQNIMYGGSGNVNGTVQYVNGGCTDQDYASFTANNVALMDRGFLTDCSMLTKISNAAKFNAAGVLMINDYDKVGLFGAGLTALAPLPAFSLTYQLGTTLLETIKVNHLSVTMSANNIAPTVTTMNVIAETRQGDPNNVIVVGSHLDSVLAGPGINDNGSGSGVNLELAYQFVITHKVPVNKIRFAWWAAEEFGLLGSYYYVRSLTPEQRNQIALNLNFDMVGSPNFFRGVYDGMNAENETIRKPSGKIQQLFNAYFDSKNLGYEPTPFNGRSDYGPFIEVGIPAGGIASGAEVIKKPSQRALYGGVANVAYDPCYHLNCDTVKNINQVVLDQFAKAAGDVLEQLVMQPNLRSFLNN